MSEFRGNSRSQEEKALPGCPKLPERKRNRFEIGIDHMDAMWATNMHLKSRYAASKYLKKPSVTHGRNIGHVHSTSSVVHLRLYGTVYLHYVGHFT